MKRVVSIFIVCAFFSKGLTAQVKLEELFQHPPASAKPWVFWYWMQAAISREGIAADLKAMKEAGIGGAYLMPIKDTTARISALITPVRTLTPQWWEMVRYAMQEAKRLDLKLAMHVSDGFALAGGPWITPELSMQKIVWSSVTVNGGKQYNELLPGPQANESYYRDIAIYAYPALPGTEMDTKHIQPVITTSKNTDAGFLVIPGSKQSFSSNDTCWIQYAFDKPFTCRTITIHTGGNNYQSHRLLLQVSDDGTVFRSIGRLQPPRHGWQDTDADVTHSIAPVTAKYFRFVYNKEGSEPGSEDLDAAKWRPSFKIMGLQLSSAPSVHQYEGKNGEVWRVGKRTTVEQVADSMCVPFNRIINVTKHFGNDGRLYWDIPAGKWTILRVGHTSTGHKNETAGAGKGLECDKFNPAAIRLQFDNWFAKAFEKTDPALAKEILKIFHVDSWECGSQNWSPLFAAAFKKRRGYDPLPYLPLMTGLPVQSADFSERFLYDVRQTIIELINDTFYGTLATLAHQKGCTFTAESVAPTMTSDGMLHYSKVDVPMGEYWLNSPTHDKPNDMLDAISGAHIYGKNIVQAEAFTTVRMAWNEHPGMLKTLQDRNYALGFNRLVYHVMALNPWLDRKPGMTLDGVGLYFQRDQTWWKIGAKAWVEYAQRCQALLQVGRPVADIAVFTGEEIPRRAILPDRFVNTLPGIFGKERVDSEKKRLANIGEPTRTIPDGVVNSANMADPEDWVDPLHGYAYDSFNPDALLRLASVKNGRIVLPGGASYGLLVIPASHKLMPDGNIMSYAVAKRLLQLVEQGATILIDTAYDRTPGLTSFPQSNDSLQVVMRKLLSGKVGRGRVLRGPYTESSFNSIGIDRDIEVTEDKQPANDIAWTHRSAPGIDIYFISNQQDRKRAIDLSVRAHGRMAEIWNPNTGKMTEAIRSWRFVGDRTEVSCKLDKNESVFIVLKEPMTMSPGPSIGGVRISSPPAHLDRNWTVKFEPLYGGTGREIRFDSLQDWSKYNDSSIRYYSGTAIYTTTFNQPSLTVYATLQLGDVANVASVKVNGIDCGAAWTYPYDFDISKAVKKGANKIEVTVANTWMNRLIGDHNLPENKRITWTTAPYRLDGKLLAPAGLTGPVQIWYH
jgi:hypothetical protein